MTDAHLDLQTPQGPLHLRLMPERCALAQDHGVLLAADLHWGKAQALRAAGAPIPIGDLAEQIDRLRRAALRTSASRVVLLGDLFHAPAGLSNSLIDRAAAALEGFPARLELVLGNHDARLGTARIARIADAWGIQRIDSAAQLAGAHLRHDPLDNGPAPAIGGHHHPAVRLGPGPSAARKLPAFRLVTDPNGAARLVLPAFSTFTAGDSLRPHRAEAVYVIADDSVIPLNP